MTLAILQSAELIQQGAEARVYRAQLHPSQPPIIVKHRFSKKYRHPSLDISLTRSRIIGEARALLRCLKMGITVPGIRFVDADEGLLGIELIEGPSIRRVLGGGAEAEEEEDSAAPATTESTDMEQSNEHEDLLETLGLAKNDLMTMIGKELGKMHTADVIHGDLTTSNMMLRSIASEKESKPQIVLIDFGLSFQSSMVEDKAVDLYVLERAFNSTHPESESLFQIVLDSYAKEIGKAWVPTKRRLDEVRLRGRKRSMVG
ncbi:serine/threonine-protein kinase bud32 [Tulasnella sp. 419]|nr:serine/threonine-protein kinase bud32 [Tulasnella sp. 419]